MFRRISLLVAGLMLLTSAAFAAQATSTATLYGYEITGGTDETLVASGRIKVRVITYTGATANNVAMFRSGAVSGAKWYITAVTASDASKSYIYFGSEGVMFDYLSVTLKQANDVVNIYF